MNDKNAVDNKETCSLTSPSTSSPLNFYEQHWNITIIAPIMHYDYINMLLQICSQRNVAHEMWRLFVIFYGLASVFLVSKTVCIPICLLLYKNL